MEESAFWSLIDRARPSVSGNPAVRPSASPAALKAVLGDLSGEEIAEFERHFYRQLVRLNRWDIWGAGYVIAGGMGDDAFHYFRSWLIGKGEAVVAQALQAPDGLGPFIDDAEVENELLEYVALELLEGRGIEEDPRDALDLAADAEPAGEAFDEDAVYEAYPRLAEQFEE